MSPTPLSGLSIVLALVVTAASLGGCSFLAATPAPARVDPGSYFGCGTPTMATVADVGLAVYGGVGLMNAIDTDEYVWAGAAAGVLALGVGSAIYGRVIQARCHRAQAEALATRNPSPPGALLAPASAAPPPVAPLRVRLPAMPDPPAAVSPGPAEDPQPPEQPAPSPLPE